MKVAVPSEMQCGKGLSWSNVVHNAGKRERPRGEAQVGHQQNRLLGLAWLGSAKHGLTTDTLHSTVQGRAKRLFAIHTYPPEGLECCYFPSDSDFFSTTGSLRTYPAQVPDQFPNKDTRRRVLLGRLEGAAESAWM